jgi:hypothetical protein
MINRVAAIPTMDIFPPSLQTGHLLLVDPLPHFLDLTKMMVKLEMISSDGIGITPPR